MTRHEMIEQVATIALSRGWWTDTMADDWRERASNERLASADDLAFWLAFATRCDRERNA